MMVFIVLRAHRLSEAMRQAIEKQFKMRKKIIGFFFVNESVDIFCIFARSFCDEL